MNLGETVRARRRELRLTQAEIADLADVSERFVREVESDKSSVRLDKLEQLVGALGLQLTLTKRL